MLLIYKIYILIFILIIIFIHNFYDKKSYNNIEQFNEKSGCPKIIKNKTNYCYYDVMQKKCRCKFQKDNLNYPFNSFSPCCNNCELRGKKDCVPDNGVYYWCINNKSKCEKQNAYIENNKISGNNCGIDILTNNVIPPYQTEDICKQNIDPCNVYKNKEDCIKNINCGYCTNINNIGKCIEGTASGPINIFKYNFCMPNKTNRNAWHHNSSIFFTNKRTSKNRNLV